MGLGTLELKTLGLGSRDLERVEYLATLEEIPSAQVVSLSACRPNRTDDDCLIILSASNKVELQQRLQGVREEHRLIVLTEAASQVFPSDEDFNAFFDNGGLCLLQTGWSDPAFRMLLTQARQAHPKFDNLELPFVSRITLSTGSQSLQAYVTAIRRTGASLFVLGDPSESNEEQSFTLYLAPGTTMHGRCRLFGAEASPRPNVWRCSMDFLDFDGISRYHLNSFLSDGFSFQSTLKSSSARSNGEFLKFLKHMAEPVLSILKMEIRIPNGPYDNTYGAAGHVWLTSLLTQWIISILEKREQIGGIDWIQLQIKETPTSQLAIYIVISLENKLELRMNDYDVLEGHSLIRNLVRTDQLDLIHLHGMRLEQYTEEKYEHLAVCFESR